MNRTSLFLSIIALAVASVQSPTAFACKCAHFDKLDEEVQNAFNVHTVIVEAEVTAVNATKIDLDAENVKGLDAQAADWKISKVWKGPQHIGDTLRTETYVECCACGKSVDKGGRYLLYLSGDSRLSVSTCSPTKPLKEAAGDIKILKKLSAPAK